jgi:hypothetical protein
MRLSAGGVRRGANGVVKVNSNTQKRVKVLSAAIGASALVAVGAVGVAIANEQAGTGSDQQVRLAEPATTTTTPPPAPATSFAAPGYTATPPKGFR